MNGSERRKEPILTLSDVVKRFGGVTAADHVCLELYPGEVFGLIGPNGSGKTTLLNLITGIYHTDAGSIRLDGRDISRLASHTRARRGIVRSFQHPRLLGRCDVLTNMRIGLDLAGKRRLPLFQKENSGLDELLAAAGLSDIDLTAGVDKLSYGQQKMLEIVRAMLSRPKVLLLDEPAAGLNSAEMDYIRSLIGIATRQNVAVLLIEHAMDLVMTVCDRITVLNFGHQITTGTPAQVQNHQGVIEAYLGGGKQATC